MEKPILSFTSHSRRLPLIDEVFRSHVANAEACGMRVCLALQEDSVPSMTDYQKGLVRAGKIELLTIEKDHGSNTKWTLCRRKHPDATMVVVDDDVVYPRFMLPQMLAASSRLPGSVLCRAARALTIDPRTGGINPFSSMERFGLSTTPLRRGDRMSGGAPVEVLDTRLSFPEHWAGCLYPPGFPEASDDTLAEARETAFHADDVYTGVLVNRTGTWLALVRTERICDKRWCSEDDPICRVSLVQDSKARFGDKGAVTRMTLEHFAREFGHGRQA